MSRIAAEAFPSAEAGPQEAGSEELTARYMTAGDHALALAAALEDANLLNDSDDFPLEKNAVYQGFTTFCWGPKSDEAPYMAYRTTLRTADIAFEGNKLRGTLVHEVIRVVNSKQEERQLGATCREHFEGVFLRRSKRLLLVGVEIADLSKGMWATPTRYNIRCLGNAMVGEWGQAEPLEALLDSGCMLHLVQDDILQYCSPGYAEKISPPLDDALLKAFALEKFYEIRDGPRQVKVNMKVNSIRSVDTLAQCFTAFVQTELTWLPMALDFHKRLADPVRWTPQWTPPELRFRNAMDVEAHEAGPVEFRRTSDPSAPYVLRQVFTTQASFSESMELHSFPFDVQFLKMFVVLDYEGEEVAEVEFAAERVTVDEEHSMLTEWECRFDSTIVTQLSSSKVDLVEYVVAFRIRRRAAPYLWRIICVLSMINVAALLTVGIDPVDNTGDRLAYLVTLLLTAVAYSIVVSSQLPNLGYLTFLDRYILHSYIYLTTLMAATSLTEFSLPSDDVETIDPYIFVAFAGIFGLWHVVVALWAVLLVVPREHAKLTADLRATDF